MFLPSPSELRHKEDNWRLSTLARSFARPLSSLAPRDRFKEQRENLLFPCEINWGLETWVMCWVSTSSHSPFPRYLTSTPCTQQHFSWMSQHQKNPKFRPVDIAQASPLLATVALFVALLWISDVCFRAGGFHDHSPFPSSTAVAVLIVSTVGSACQSADNDNG